MKNFFDNLRLNLMVWLAANTAGWVSRAKALTDGGAWLLIVPFVFIWFQIDSADIKSSLVWLLKLPIIVGTVIILSRLVFPQIRLGNLMDQVEAGSVAASIVVCGLLLFVGMLIMTAVGWAK